MRPPLLFAALSALLLCSCFSPGDGESPPLASIYFPTGLALDTPPDANAADPSAPKAEHLFLASSDFDLQYRASALASYALEKVEALLPALCNTDADCAEGKVCDTPSAATPSSNPSYFCVDPSMTAPCGTLGERSAADQLLYPGRCNSIDTSKVLDHTVEIGAFATDLIFRNRPASANADGQDHDYVGRLFSPVRGDATLHWIDVNQGTLDCGQSNTSDGSCDAHHRIGDDADTESPNDLRQQPEPFGIAIDDRAVNVAVTNQTTGSVSLFVNHWDTTQGYPELVSILGGLPSAPVGVAALPTPLPTPPGYEPGFLAVYRDAPQVDLLRVHQTSVDERSVVDGEYYPRTLARAATSLITVNSVGSDSRGIVVDDEARDAAYAVCDAAQCAGLKDTIDDPALTACRNLSQNAECYQRAPIPNVYVANRAPASLLVGSFTPDPAYAAGSSELPAFTDSLPLTLGPSRVILGKVRVPSNAPEATPDPSGNYVLEPRVFVVCFDSRKIFVYDPARRLIESTVSTGRGPFAMAVDEARGRAYLAHFTDSYLGVISLDQRFPQTYAAIIASIGVPTPPRTSK